MFKQPKRLAVILSCVCSFACSLSVANPKESAPGKPVLVFRSTFVDYQMMTDEPIANWREINDSVGRIGGWRAYLKEAQQRENKVDVKTDPKLVPQLVPQLDPKSVPKSDLQPAPQLDPKVPPSPAHHHHNQHNHPK